MMGIDLMSGDVKLIVQLRCLVGTVLVLFVQLNVGMELLQVMKFVMI